MSFTLVRRKGGEEVPVRMSIWDAFKGVPNPKLRKPKVIMPRRAQAEDRHWQHPCCGKVHGPKSAEKKDDQTGGGKKADSEDSECKSGNPHSTPEVEEYSQEDDATIVKMKNEKATWLMILDAIGKKSQSQLQAHWRRDLQARADKDRTKGDEERAKAEKEPARQGAHKDRISRAKTEEKGDEATGKKSDELGDTNLRAWAESYDQKKWIAVASKHYDITGQRITPATAKRLAEGKKRPQN